MSNLSKYIEKVKEYKKQNPNITEEKLIRYVFLDLGQRFSFNLNFHFGNTKIRKNIYDNSQNEEALNDAMKSNIIICKTVSYILEYILKNLDVNIRTVVDPKDKRKYPHVYNIVTPKEGEEYIIDLQEDMASIQTHSFTKNYGLSVVPNKPPILNRFDIEQMDRELGFIDNEHYYTDDYLYLLKSDIGYFANFAEKVEFVLGNIDVHENKNIQYAERKWNHEKILKEIFSNDELKRIHIIDCYQKEGNEIQYKNCMAVDVSNGTDIYMYSIEENRYHKMEIQEFARATKNGLVHLQGIRNLRQEIKGLREENESR